MRADMQCRVDALCDDADGLQILRVVHLVAGITDPAGRMHIHDMGKIDDFHNTGPDEFKRRRLIDHKSPRNARCAPSKNSPLKKHSRNVPSFTHPPMSCPSPIPASAAARAPSDGEASEVRICPG